MPPSALPALRWPPEKRPQDAGTLGAKDGPRRPWMAAVQLGRKDARRAPPFWKRYVS